MLSVSQQLLAQTDCDNYQSGMYVKTFSYNLEGNPSVKKTITEENPSLKKIVTEENPSLMNILLICIKPPC